MSKVSTPSRVTRSSSKNTFTLESQTSRKATPRKNKTYSSVESDSESEKSTIHNVSPRKKKSSGAGPDCVTPPKLKKDENDENELFSPSFLLTKLNLNSPEKSLEPKKLHFNEICKTARIALHSTATTDMPCREKEHEDLHNFINGHLRDKSSGSLYISGPPGTGKTASLTNIINQEDVANDFKVVYVNCTAIKSSNSIYSKIMEELKIKTAGRTEKDYIFAVEKYLKHKHKMILLVLDEIDQLESKKQSVLYTIFEWPSIPDSRIILIGIANALDLTDRILPRLQARCELKPKLMHFAPYSKEQLVEIFKDRLKSAGVSHLFSPIALQMLASKVASISGDARRALDIGRRVIELVERNRRTEVLKEVDSKENDKNNKEVGLQHVIGVLNNVYGTSNNLNDEESDSLPLQQKIILCSLLLIIKKARNKDVTVGKLHDIYKKVCSKKNISAVDHAEFVGLCSLIETRGIIRVTGRKEPRLHKVSLEWDDDEIGSVMRDKQLMSSILDDVNVLGKL